jgi:hypothetical protein
MDWPCNDGSCPTPPQTKVEESASAVWAPKTDNAQECRSKSGTAWKWMTGYEFVSKMELWVLEEAAARGRFS